MTTSLSVKEASTHLSKDELRALTLDAMYGPRKLSDEPWAELVYGIGCDVENIIDMVIEEINP
jgi:hypothetical protein